MACRKFNVDLLKQTQRLILKNPGNFDVNEDPKFSIEGWTVTAAGLDVNQVDDTGDVYTEARKLLGISAAQADQLFVGYNWPAKLCRQYRVDPVSIHDFRKNARLAARRIDQFIKRESYGN